MNTHRESGVKFMSPVSLPNLRFPENHLIHVCVGIQMIPCRVQRTILQHSRSLYSIKLVRYREQKKSALWGYTVELERTKIYPTDQCV